jgi:fatty-acyl-CoA synthase
MVIGNLCCTAYGACMVTPGEAFDPLLTLETVSEERCTSLYGVPSMFVAELARPRFSEFDLRSLRTGIMAGAPCPIEVMRKVQSLMHMPEVTIGYGMTETSPVSAQTARNDPLERRVATVGRVHAHVEVKIVDPATGIVPTARRANTARGLLRDAGLLEQRGGDARAIDAAGWMHTGTRDHGRGGLSQDRGRIKGSDHPRRREHLPAGRRVPPPAPRGPGGPGGRCAQRALRRGR